MTITEEKISSFINTHLDEISGKTTSSKLAEMIGVSQSAVIKFSKKLGYPSFKRMLLDITSDQPDDQLNEELEYAETTETTAQKLQQQFSKSYAITAGLNPVKNIMEAASYIINANTVMIYAYNEREITLAKYLSNELARIGVRSITGISMTNISSQVVLSKKDDVVIIISKSGETREMINYLKIAKKNGCKIISITRAQKNTIAKLSDVNLKTVEYLNRTFMREQIVTQSFMFLFSLIIMEVVKLNPEKANETIMKNRLVTKPMYKEP